MQPTRAHSSTYQRRCQRLSEAIDHPVLFEHDGLVVQTCAGMEEEGRGQAKDHLQRRVCTSVELEQDARTRTAAEQHHFRVGSADEPPT